MLRSTWRRLANFVLSRLQPNCVTMEEVSSDLLAPPGEGVRGMTCLDRNKFAKSVQVPWVCVAEGNAGKAVWLLKKYLLKMENLKPVQDLAPVSPSDEGQSTSKAMKKALLNPNLVRTYEDFSLEDKAALEEVGIGAENFHVGMLELCYENWKADEILKAILPHDCEGFSSYSKVGHLLHLNLREHLHPFGQVIGQVLLDKVKGCRTVVNKADSINSTYRNFRMEVLAGEPDTVVEVRENYCRYQLDFALVYWNPRLSTEHERIILKLDPNDILYDVFAGVGPFAMPAARKKCFVLANDLNPHSYKWLRHNVEVNRVAAQVQCFNKDGRDFIRQNVAADMIRRWTATPHASLHVTMNLPASAIDFVDAFLGACGTRREGKVVAPTVHVYAFSSEKDPALDVCKRVERALGVSLGSNLLEVFRVRDVSPRKEMMRVSFILPEHLLFSKRSQEDEPCEEDVQNKRIHLESLGSNG